jgi:hypothetical protein
LAFDLAFLLLILLFSKKAQNRASRKKFATCTPTPNSQKRTPTEKEIVSHRITHRQGLRFKTLKASQGESKGTAMA